MLALTRPSLRGISPFAHIQRAMLHLNKPAHTGKDFKVKAESAGVAGCQSLRCHERGPSVISLQVM